MFQNYLNTYLNIPLLTVMFHFSERLQKKLDVYLENKSFENLLLSWLIDGSQKEKFDTYELLKGINDLSSQHKLKSRIGPSKEVKRNMYHNIKETLNQSRFNFENEVDMSIVDTRAWLISCWCICAQDCEQLKEIIKYLNSCFGDNIDEYTQYYAAEGMVNGLNNKIGCYLEEIHKFIKEHKILDNINNQNINFIPKFKWCLLLWYIKYADHPEMLDSRSTVNCYDKLIRSVFEKENIQSQSNVLYSLASVPMKQHVDLIIYLFESILQTEKENKLVQFNIMFYINLVRTCIGICFIDDDSLLKKKEYLTSLLFRFLKILRNYPNPIWNPVKNQILRSFRKYHHSLGELIVIDNLIPELLASEPSVITNACKTLQTFYNVNQTTAIILDAVIKEITRSGKDFSNETIIALSHSLKWMCSNNNYVLESLEDKMYRGESDMIRDTSRRLISEMGGASAIKKLEVKTLLKDGYNQQINKSQEDVERMFHITIIDAKRGFNIAMAMEIIVFFTGILLILVSGFMAILNGENSSSQWAGAGASAGAGMLTTLYSLFISKPRDKVKENVTHLMYLKIIFLGYLRELNQLDQSFNQHIMEEELITQETIHTYYDNIEKIMNHCIKLLNYVKYDQKYLVSGDYKINDNINKPGSIIDFKGFSRNQNNQGIQTSFPQQYLTSQELSEFIQSNFSNPGLSEKVKDNKIDSEVILNINQQGWEELGISNNLEQSKIKMGIQNKIRTI